MNGRIDLLLDTNAVVQLLKGNPRVDAIISSAGRLRVSVVTCLEFKSYANLPVVDSALFDR
jgi:predicted nucleic acid-binding protein